MSLLEGVEDANLRLQAEKEEREAELEAEEEDEEEEDEEEEEEEEEEQREDGGEKEEDEEDDGEKADEVSSEGSPEPIPRQRSHRINDGGSFTIRAWGNPNRGAVSIAWQLWRACEEDDPTKALELVNHEDIKVTFVDKNDDTYLHVAAGKGHSAVVKALLARGAAPNAANIYGFTPLHSGSINGHVDICNMLLQAGAQVNAVAQHNYIPLHLAAFKGHKHTCVALLERGANPNALSLAGWSPLMEACENGHEKVARVLVDRGTDMNIVSKDGKVCSLLSVCRRGWPWLVTLFGEKGANMSVVADGKSPLHHACTESWPQPVTDALFAAASPEAEAAAFLAHTPSPLDTFLGLLASPAGSSGARYAVLLQPHLGLCSKGAPAAPRASAFAQQPLAPAGGPLDLSQTSQLLREAIDRIDGMEQHVRVGNNALLAMQARSDSAPAAEPSDAVAKELAEIRQQLQVLQRGGAESVMWVAGVVVAAGLAYRFFQS